ncbi:MAG: hypothetical protein ACYCPQ_05860 [Elusimicrobiota bacterium]
MKIFRTFLLLTVALSAGCTTLNAPRWSKPGIPQKQFINFPEPPTRDNLWGSFPYQGTVPKDASYQELYTALLLPRESQRKLDALYVLKIKIQNAETKSQAASARQFWRQRDLDISLMNQILNKEPDIHFRRWAVANLFGALFASCRDHILLDANLPYGQKEWQDLYEIFQKGLHDRDPRLAEFFERYIPLPANPNWRNFKHRDEKNKDRIISLFPGLGPSLENAWALAEGTEADQAIVSRRSIRRLQKMTGLNPNRKNILIAGERLVYAYRIYTLWANLFPRIMIDMLRQYGKADLAGQLGIKAEPVKLGWPNFTSLWNKN